MEGGWVGLSTTSASTTRDSAHLGHLDEVCDTGHHHEGRDPVAAEKQLLEPEDGCKGAGGRGGSVRCVSPEPVEKKCPSSDPDQGYLSDPNQRTHVLTFGLKHAPSESVEPLDASEPVVLEVELFEQRASLKALDVGDLIVRKARLPERLQLREVLEPSDVPTLQCELDNRGWVDVALGRGGRRLGGAGYGPACRRGTAVG